MSVLGRGTRLLPRLAAVRLDALVAGAAGARVVGDSAVEVASLAYDSRKVGPGTLFFCVPGEKRDGHEFAAQAAVEAGAAALVVERELELDVAQVVVADARAAMAPFAAAFQGDPTAELKVVGVTGTNGKTTTAYLVREILEAAGIQCGLMGTVKQVVGGVEEEVERTTPEAIDLQATFRRMLERRRPGLRDGGLLARDGPAPRRRDPLRRRALHQPDPGPPRLPRRHGGLLRAPSGCSSRPSPESRDRQRRRPLRPPPGRGIRLRTFSAEGADADYRATDVSFDAAGASFTVSMGRN